MLVDSGVEAFVVQEELAVGEGAGFRHITEVVVCSSPNRGAEVKDHVRHHLSSLIAFSSPECIVLEEVDDQVLRAFGHMRRRDEHRKGCASGLRHGRCIQALRPTLPTWPVQLDVDVVEEEAPCDAADEFVASVAR